MDLSSCQHALQPQLTQRPPTADPLAQTTKLCDPHLTQGGRRRQCESAGLGSRPGKTDVPPQPREKSLSQPPSQTLSRLSSQQQPEHQYNQRWPCQLLAKHLTGDLLLCLISVSPSPTSPSSSCVAVAPCLHPWSRRFHAFPQSSAALSV
ncbi:unnamed protein product [Gadus morhua 'NCC']